MSQLGEIQQTQQDIEASFKKRLDEFDAQLKAAAVSAVPRITISKVSEDFYAFRDLIWKLLSVLRQQISDCMKTIDAMDQRQRLKVVLFNNVPEKPGEDTLKVTMDLIQSKLSVKSVSPSSLKRCHRFGAKQDGRERPILVRFRELSMKTDVWNNKKGLKGTSISMSEFLTRSRQAVFVKARRHFGMRNCWSLDGVISVKLPSGDRRKITTSDELDALMSKFPQPCGAAAKEQRARGTAAAGSGAK